MALGDILKTSNKKGMDLDDEAIKLHVHNNLSEYQKLIAY